MFAIIKDSIMLVVGLMVIFLNVFNIFDQFARGFNLGPILTGLIFVFSLMFVLQIISLPFSIYSTFVLEKKYGFNKTTVKTFILDMIKSLILTIIIGSIVLAALLFFFEKAGGLAWLYAWGFIAIVQIILVVIAPVVIMPLFNKFVPLEEGELKSEIEDFAKNNKFPLQGVYKMDGSKRSTKSNAYFTGFGRFRRIVLFDTLIEKHSVQELVSVLAHEIGHYKKKHIIKLMVFSILTLGLTLFLMSVFMKNPGLFAAFGVQELSIYVSLILFSYIYLPLALMLGIFSSHFSRKYEYEADRFAVETYKKPEVFISALKTLCRDNLANLTPHPLKVFLEYSHPPVLERIKAINVLNVKNGELLK
ncbi:M48 family metallopeptidase [Candidatus Margulisiibacteriota bacterium]